MTWRKVSLDDRPLSSFLTTYLERLGVEFLELETLDRPASFLGREESEEARDLARVARARYRQHGYGFWPSLLSELATASPTTRNAVLGRAVEHDVAPTTTQVLSVEELGAWFARGAHRGLPARRIVSLTSRVRMSVGSRHLPMLDFTTSDLTLAMSAAEVLGLHGVLVASGRSFHFFGDELLEDEGLRPFLARAQLLAPIVDDRWVSHQLIDGRCALRISTDTERHTAESYVVAVGRATN